jgi:hypothetical protein
MSEPAILCAELLNAELAWNWAATCNRDNARAGATDGLQKSGQMDRGSRTSAKLNFARAALALLEQLSGESQIVHRCPRAPLLAYARPVTTHDEPGRRANGPGTFIRGTG